MSHHPRPPVGETLPLAISYYQLYCDIAAAAAAAAAGADETTTEDDDDDDDDVQQTTGENEHGGVSGDGSSNNADRQQQQPWLEDTEWDAAREAAAERELRGNLERCRIPAAAASAASRTARPTSDDNKHHDSSSADCWDRFYKHHQTNFFKDRHWPVVAFPNEFGGANQSSTAEANRRRVLVEVGCGVGNTLLPLLESQPNEEDANSSSLWTVYGLDLSPAAIELLRQDERFQRAAAAADGNSSNPRAFAAVADISQPDSIPRNFVGVATVTSLLFCLSAIPPQHHETAVRNAWATLGHGGGGVLVLRDYGRYDEAQMKLGRQRHKLVCENYYRKHDGTCCYYFTVERIRQLFLSNHSDDDDDDCTIEELECRYIRRVYTNRSDRTQRRRVWVQARFRKTAKISTHGKTVVEV